VLAAAPHHARVRVLSHIKRLDDCFGDFLVRVTCRVRPDTSSRKHSPVAASQRLATSRLESLPPAQFIHAGAGAFVLTQAYLSSP
jgi:hypothetical protein